MTDITGALLILGFLFVVFIIWYFRIKLWLKALVSVLCLVAIVSIVTLGHSDWNQEKLIVNQIRAFGTTNHLNMYSDKEAVNEIISFGPNSSIYIESITKLSKNKCDPIYRANVQINGTTYDFRIILRNAPFCFSIIEDWELLQVNRSS